MFFSPCHRRHTKPHRSVPFPSWERTANTQITSMIWKQWLRAPHPPNLDHPLLMPPESPAWTLRFLMQRVHQSL